jgi:ribonuclease BN (tRNA processing enzyme)
LEVQDFLLPKIQSFIIFIGKEKMGRFKSTKAQKFSIKSGPLYRNLKSHHSFICPDGNILSGIYFTHPYAIGLKLSYTTNVNGTKILVALSSKAGQVIF